MKLAVFPEHSNDCGDWCPFSDQPVPEGYADYLCPQGCRASNLDEDDDWCDDDDDQ